MHPLLEEAEEARSASLFKEAQRLFRAFLGKPIDPPGNTSLSVDPSLKAEALLGLADVERIQGYFPQAMKHYRAAGKIFKKIHPPLVVDTQVGWALAARAMGQPRQALSELRKAMTFYRKRKDPEGQAFVHWALGGTLRIAGGMKEGLKELLKARDLYRKLDDREGKAYVCCALGGIYRMLGRYAESGKYYGEANRRMRNLKDTFGTAYSYCGLGNVERMAGRFKAALPFYRKAEKLYGKIGDRVSYAYTLWSLGTTYKMLGRYQEAQRAFAKADELFKKTGDTRGRVYTLLGFAELEHFRVHVSKCLRYWNDADRLADHGDFQWEKFHVISSLSLFTLNGLESIKGAFIGLRRKKIGKHLKREKKRIAGLYRTAGSKFSPTSVPINWP